MISVNNQFDEQIALQLYSLEEIREENTDEILLERIKQLEENVLTSEMTFPIAKQRSVQLHAHVEANETDTKIDDELRQNDAKELVAYRKFAKVGIRCLVRMKNNEVKKILVRYSFSNILNDDSSLERFCYRTSCNGYCTYRWYTNSNKC